MAQTLQKIYSDIDLTFNRQPGKGDLALRYDDQAVISSVRNLLLTNFYERPFQPSVGSNINGLLFENISPVTASIIETEIQNVISNYEPRATINTISVTAAPDSNQFSVSLSVLVGNQTQPTSFSLILQRTR